MKARELYERLADEANMPVSTVGKVARLALIALAGLDPEDLKRLLARYRLAPRKEV